MVQPILATLCRGRVHCPQASDTSGHVIDAGGHTVDFYVFYGTPTTGADPNAMKILCALAPVMPNRYGVGQLRWTWPAHPLVQAGAARRRTRAQSSSGTSYWARVPILTSGEGLRPGMS
ncbi:hypothetical protein B5P19_15960 [Clavibacter sepedonicus]|uniref:Uncharacterized protein n=1 Tax=Clavibacter sepedonicus TaxID=31964 RepID=B0RJ28_CLASE|nr:hypothetical protein B5P19_15960 [Clavibacter sepedonicus]OQJ50895.1 hypothetical protein B5P20_15790 [Clavibacter sepedonicus]CAQ03217.1 hypothetical protein pCS0034 [Clavibacter sepedonicus]